MPIQNRVSSVGLSLVVKYFCQSVQQLWEGFGGVVGAGRVLVPEIVGFFPLVNVVLSVGVVGCGVVVEHAFSHL